MEDRTLTFIKHSDLDLLFTIKLASLEGTIPTASLSSLLDHPHLKHAGAQQSIPSDLYVTVSLYADNKVLCLPIRSSHKVFRSKANYVWNETIQFPIKYRDLPLSTQLVVNVYDIAGPLEPVVLGGSTLRLFGKKSTLKKGKQRLFLWKGVEGDGRVETGTSSKVGIKDEMGRLEKLVKKHESGDITRMDWLDKLAFRKIEQIHASESLKSNDLFIYIDLPRFSFPVVYSEATYPPPLLLPLLPSSLSPLLTTGNAPLNTTSASGSSPFTFSQPGQTSLFAIVDPEIARENVVEGKYRRLVRSHRNGPLDRELKPNAKIRDELNEILHQPPTHILTSIHRDLLWQFRFYLTRDKRALTKFLKSVVWTDPGEVKQAVEVLLPMWAEVEVDDALELLGPGEGSRDPRVRAYAVGRLGKADDEELMLYLLQLVQALKFETRLTASPSSSSNLRQSVPRHSHSASQSRSQLQNSSLTSSLDHLPTLEEFLIERSAQNEVLGNCFHWYIAVEIEDKISGKMFEEVAKKFERRVQELQGNGLTDKADVLRRQTEFVSRISSLAKELRNSKDARPKKVERLRSVLHDTKSNLGSFAPIPLPLDARISIIGIDAEKSSVFKSNLFPLRLHLLCSDSTSYPVIFKNGDDLRQDQLVIQLFTLMDRLLRKENLDLKLMPYRVLATGGVEGMVQFVESSTLADISNQFSSGLLGYLREHNADPGSVGTYGVKPEVLDTYIRSCAGYCVVTYLLGVGDRHLDNLLLSPDGHFFHVDFGYILGRDPKPFPPSIKLCKEMVDAMGGVNSEHYRRFKDLCYTGFTLLRKNANLIINLVALMVDGNIQDIKFEPDKAVMKVQDKFLLNLSEEDAIKAFEALLKENNYFASVLDRIHFVAQYWRS